MTVGGGSVGTRRVGEGRGGRRRRERGGSRVGREEDAEGRYCCILVGILWINLKTESDLSLKHNYVTCMRFH